MKSFHKIGLMILAGTLSSLVLGCGADFGGASSSSDNYNDSASSYDGGGWYPGEDTMASKDWGQADPEQEMDFDFETAAAGEHYVFIPVTLGDIVVRVNADNLQINLIPVGISPKRVVTLPGTDVAVVLNTGTDDLSVISSSTDGDKVENVDIIPGCNQLAVGPDARSVIAFYNSSRAVSGDEVGDFQTVQVVRFSKNAGLVADPPKISVGFNPSAVFFSSDGKEAFIVTDDGISVLTLGELEDGQIAETLPVSNDPLELPDDREVFVSDTGDYAVIRDVSKPTIRILNLNNGDLDTLEMPGLPTDLDFIPDSNRCLVMMREQQRAAVIDLAHAGDEDSIRFLDLGNTAAGAAVVGGDGHFGVMYSTVSALRSVTVVDLTDEELPMETFLVQKEILGVAVSPGGSHALLFHESDPGGNDIPAVAKSEGYTLLNLETGYRKLVLTDSAWSRFVFITGEDGQDQAAYILLPSRKSSLNHLAQSIDLKTYLVEETILHSSPDSLLYVPAARKVAINQEHPNGRISFLDVDTHNIETRTGFELNSLIH